MASNFKIELRRNRNHISIKLKGDFNGSSACILMNVISKKCVSAKKVIIHTSSLKNIHPFGLNVFRNNFHGLKNRDICLVFTGRYADQLAV